MTTTENNLVRACVLCERWRDVETLLSGVLEVVPSDHPDPIPTQSGLVHVKIRLGRLDEAEEDCVTLVALIERHNILWSESPHAQTMYEQMRAIYGRQGRERDMEDLRTKHPALNRTASEKRLT